MPDWDWTAELPSVSGIDFWDSSENGSQWQPQSLSPGSTYTGDVWVSTDPNSPPPGVVTINFVADPPGGAKVQKGVNVQSAGTWTDDSNWGQDPKTLEYFGTATATGGMASLKDLAADISGKASDWTVLASDPRNAKVLMMPDDSVMAGSHVNVGSLLELVEQRMREAVKKAANDPKYATYVDVNSAESGMRSGEINSVFTLQLPAKPGQPAPYQTDCFGMARIILCKVLIDAIGANQFDSLGANLDAICGAL